jgi:hypothetical protein
MAERARPAGAQWRRAAPLSAALFLIAAGCASHPDPNKPSEPQMIGLLAVLPGIYDNSAQAELEARTGVRPGHVAVALTITHVYAPRLGHYVYYAQETAAGEPLRVLSQKVYSFKFDEKRGIVETLYELVEPRRWRDGQLNKDVFSSIDTEDVQAEGCQLLWKKKDAGFVATHDPKVCPDPEGATLTLVEFSAGVLTVGEYKFRKLH